MRNRVRLCSTEGLPNPTYYVQALQGEYSKWAFCEKRSIEQKGKWGEKIFEQSPLAPIDLEIGTGNGYHFAHYAEKNPERNFIGIEWKYKPLIQSIRRVLKSGAMNTRILRYDASFPQHIFAEEELDNVMIHFPDPWSKDKQKKNRLISSEFLSILYGLQKPGSKVEFKTDNRDYFDWAVEHFKESKYQVNGLTYDLHSSEYSDENFVTHFEKIFLGQGLPIHQITLLRP